MPQLLALNPCLVFATLSAWGEDGPWADRKGFDSLVQHAVGFAEAEGRAWVELRKEEGEDEVMEGDERIRPRPLPCQAIDHATGYLLAYIPSLPLSRSVRSTDDRLE